MGKLPDHILKSLELRRSNLSLRKLPNLAGGIDFCSNDYLGFSTLNLLESQFNRTYSSNAFRTGSSGSRLISGNSRLKEEFETFAAKFHDSESALLYNSGYDANLGLLACLPQKQDLVITDELIHASIYDGIRLSFAKHYKFKHNDVKDLTDLLDRHASAFQSIYIVVESVYSMDGDQAPLKEITKLTREYTNAFLIVDEAHAIGVFGNKGEGLTQKLGVAQDCLARIYTYGKAMGCHGAAVVGSEFLKTYLLNFSRSLIYTTALPDTVVAHILSAYELLKSNRERKKLEENITYFRNKDDYKNYFINSESAIQCCVIGDNLKVDEMEAAMKGNGILCKAVKSPTVPEGKERIRFCVHAFNSSDEIDKLFSVLVSS